MPVGIGVREQMLPKYLSAKNLNEELSPQQSYCLFLDMDGTLAEFTLNPKDSVIPQSTLTLLASIQNQGINVAIVTGRSLSEAREMTAPLQLPIAATHGLEISFDANGNNDNTKKISVDTDGLAKIRQMITQFCMPYDEFYIEHKPYSVALHYRQNPMLAEIARTIMSKALESHSGWILRSGKYVLEAIPKGADKGSAILALLKTMQSASTLCPIFIGDDITDEAGFAAVQGESLLLADGQIQEDYQKSITGMGIKVGTEPTCANYYVDSIQDVTDLLHSFLTFCQGQRSADVN